MFGVALAKPYFLLVGKYIMPALQDYIILDFLPVFGFQQFRVHLCKAFPYLGMIDDEVLELFGKEILFTDVRPGLG